MQKEINRIAKVIAAAGVASRREVERMILDGRVKVNGVVISSPALNVSASDKISVDGREIKAPNELRLYIYHKPVGLVVSHHDPEGRKTIFETLPREYGRLVSVGRLDLNSEGLLLLTNSGEFQRFMESPDNGFERVYDVRARGVPTKGDIKKLERGVSVDGVDYGAIDLRVMKTMASNSWLRVVLREGKNREIRKTLNSIGLEVNRLIRVSYAGIKLGDLKPGEVRKISVPREILDRYDLRFPTSRE
jgi:23S rRNA pseudouridine2605 synthase